MATELEQAFIQYSKKINDIIKNVAILDKKNFIENKLETSSEFHALVRATRDEFGNTEIAPNGDMTLITLIHGTHYEFGDTGDYRNEANWRYAVGNVLRRSGFYIKMLEKNLSDPSEEFEAYLKVFKSSERKISYSALLEYVDFSQDDIDFGHFQIKRFSRDEFDAVLGKSINEIFYPRAAVKLEEIKDYWFIYFEQAGPAPKIGSSHFLDFELSPDDSRVNMRYSPLSEPVESIVKPLVLFNWQSDYWRGEAADEKEEQETGWMGFNIPLVLKVTDNLYEPPFPSPAHKKFCDRERRRNLGSGSTYLSG